MGGIVSSVVGIFDGGNKAKKNASNAAADASRAAVSSSAASDARSADLYDYYKRTYQPLEQKAVDAANEAGSPQMQETRAARAGESVRQQSDLSSKANEHNLESLGVNPNSGQFVGLKSQEAAQEGANVAGASNLAREQERQYGLSAKLDAASLGRNMVGNSLNATAQSTAALNSAARSGQIAVDQSRQQAQDIGAGVNAGINTYKAFSAPPSRTNADGSWSGVGPAPESLKYDQSGNMAAYDGIGTGASAAAAGSVADEAAFGEGAMMFLKGGGKVRSLPMKRSHIHGGSVTGPGTGTSDSVPVSIDGDTPGALSSGEYVINAKAVKKFGVSKLDQINKLGLPRGHKMKNGTHLADGGKVKKKEHEHDDDDEGEGDEDQYDDNYATGGIVKRRYFPRYAQAA